MKACSLALPMRKKTQKDDSCIACHMPRSGSSDIVHTAVTDHRILRKPEQGGEAWRAPPGAGLAPLVHFHRALVDADDKNVSRDLGIALIGLARAHVTARGQLGQLALPILENAVETWPDDVAAREALAYALWSQGHTKDAFAAYEAVLQLAPERELSLLDGATISEQLDLEGRAIDLWRRAGAVNPWAADPHYRLSRLLAQRHEWKEAIAECSRAIQITPRLVEPRVLLINCYLRSGHKDKARTEFATLEALNPPDLDILRRWFAEESK